MSFLNNNTIRLRALEPSDLDWLFQVENNTSFWEISNTTQPFSKAVLECYIANAHQDIYTVKQLRLVIEYDKKPIGTIDLYNYDPRHHRVGVGILILPEYESRGIASKALELLIGYAFGHLQMHQLYAYVATDNAKSLALFKKHHFEITGRKKDWIYSDKHYKDEFILQLINKND